MSTDELEQALVASKFKNAERNILEVIAKMLELPEAAVARVVLAWETAQGWKPVAHGTHEELNDLYRGFELPDDIQEAIKRHVRFGIRRAAVRWHIQHEKRLQVSFQALLPKSQTRRMCDGCVEQLACVRDMLSTPQRCWDGQPVYTKELGRHDRPRAFQHQVANAVPLSLDGNIVTLRCEHPRGVYKVNVMDVQV